MKQLAMYWSAMVIMYVIASKLRNRKENFKWVSEAINVPILSVYNRSLYPC